MTDGKIRVLAVLLMGIAALLSAGVPRSTAQAQPGSRCFEETNQCIAGPIRAYWEANGGLEVFGYPITRQAVEEVEGQSLEVQWFERDRLEIQPDGSVTAGRLGARLLELQGRPWQSFPTVEGTPAGCLFFAETGHSLCGAFLSYWQNNGGLERFGFPITEPMNETIGDWSGNVQYFERRRMELHVELSGTPVLLGLLGRDVYTLLTGTAPTPAPPVGEVPACVRGFWANWGTAGTYMEQAYLQTSFRATLGCPGLSFRGDVPASTQGFQQGEMLRVDLPPVPGAFEGAEYIYALLPPGPTFQRFNDPWVAGVDSDQEAGIEAPPGLYVPWRGFGKVWVLNDALRQTVGWAVEPRPQDRTAAVAFFENNSMVIYLEDTRDVYVFGSPDQPAQVYVLRAP